MRLFRPNPSARSNRYGSSLLGCRCTPARKPKAIGACWMGDELWRTLELDRFYAHCLGVSREGTDWEKVLRILTIYRLLSPRSEWRLHRHWFGSTALSDLLEVDALDLASFGPLWNPLQIGPTRRGSSGTGLPCDHSKTPAKLAFNGVLVVRTAGLEPARLSALPPQSSASANFATCATEGYPSNSARELVQEHSNPVALLRSMRTRISDYRITELYRT